VIVTDDVETVPFWRALVVVDVEVVALPVLVCDAVEGPVVVVLVPLTVGTHVDELVVLEVFVGMAVIDVMFLAAPVVVPLPMKLPLRVVVTVNVVVGAFLVVKVVVVVVLIRVYVVVVVVVVGVAVDVMAVWF